MRPLIWGGQHYVAVAPLTDEPKIGDILMFRQGDNDASKLIVHRLVGIYTEQGATRYLTRGDNCLSCEYVNCDAIIGRVVEIHRLSGFRPWFIVPFKSFSVDNRYYKAYSNIWSRIWPLRRLLYRCRGYVRRLRSKPFKDTSK